MTLKQVHENLILERYVSETKKQYKPQRLEDWLLNELVRAESVNATKQKTNDTISTKHNRQP